MEWDDNIFKSLKHWYLEHNNAQKNVCFSSTWNCLEDSLKPKESTTISYQTIDFSSWYLNPRAYEGLLQIMPCLRHNGFQKFAILYVCTCLPQQAASSLKASVMLTVSFAKKEFHLVLITSYTLIGSLVPNNQHLLRTWLAHQKQGILTNGQGGGHWPCHRQMAKWKATHMAQKSFL